jgi:HdeA/HdeB family
MRRRFALAFAVGVLALAWQAVCLSTGARAATVIPCDAFAKNADASWTVLATTYIEGPNVKVQEGAILKPGFIILGYDIAAMIAKACPSATVVLPGTVQPSTPGTPAQPQQQIPSLLATYADANGNIDVRELTCGHLNIASPDEAELLLAWYSGWYNGLAKGRGINLARLRYNIHSVIDYCKANRDKRLTDVMELMLK